MSARRRPAAWLERAAPTVVTPAWLAARDAAGDTGPGSARRTREPDADAARDAEREAAYAATVAALEAELARAREDLARERETSAATREERDALATALAEARAASAARERQSAIAEAALVTRIEHDVVRLASAIAERVVARELSVDPSLVAAWAREAVHELAVDEGVTVTLAIAPDLERPVRAAGTLVEGRTIAVVVDPDLAHASAEVRAGASTIPISKDERLACVVEHLSTVAPVGRDAAAPDGLDAAATDADTANDDAANDDAANDDDAMDVAAEEAVARRAA